MPGAMPCNSTWSIPLKQHPDDFVLDTRDRFHASVRACHGMAYLDQVYHRKPVDQAEMSRLTAISQALGARPCGSGIS
jgi:hypothetical protein